MANPDKFPTSLVAGIAVTLAVTAYLVLPTLGGGPDVDMSEEAVLQRIKPIGSVNTTQAKPAPPYRHGNGCTDGIGRPRQECHAASRHLYGLL